MTYTTIRLCDTAGCVAPHKAKGLCSAHYYQTPERKAARALGMARWRATPEGKAAQAERNARWYATDAGKASEAASHARYMATDKGRADTVERNWAAAALRRATKAGAVIGDIPADTRAMLRSRFGETCLVDGCDNAATDVDHVIALANGGVHDISNLQTLCGSCNNAKGKANTDHRPEKQ